MNRSWHVAGFASALLATGANAAELQYGVKVGVGTSDNIRRTPSNENSESIATAGIDLMLERAGGRVEADVQLDLSYVEYLDESYDGEVVGMANADVRINFMPQRFIWVLTENFGQSAIDPFAASTPSNREDVNFLTTGPDLTFRLGSAASMTLFGRYSMTSFENSSFDDDRVLGGLSLGRELSARSNLSLNMTAERVEFDDSTAGSNYDRQSAFLRYETEGARTTIGAEAGVSEIHDHGETSSSPLFEIDISRDLSARSVLTLRGGVRSSDASTALRVGNQYGQRAPGSPDRVSSTDPFDTSHATLGWQFSAQRTQFGLSAGWEKTEYENQTSLDRERNFYQATASRQVTPRVNLRAQASLYKTDYDASGQDDDEVNYGLFLSWNAVGRLFVELEVQRFDRDSSNPLSEYNETRAFLRFAWRNSGRASGAR